MQGVERVEELFLRLLLVFQELDVVDEQDIDFAVAATETLGLAVADRVDEVVGELFGTDVTHAGAVEKAHGVVPDRVQQVRLAEPGFAVDEQRVVRLGRRLGDGDGRGVGKSVAGPDHEGFEGVLRVQPGGFDLSPASELATGAQVRARRLILVPAGLVRPVMVAGSVFAAGAWRFAGSGHRGARVSVGAVDAIAADVR